MRCNDGEAKGVKCGKVEDLSDLSVTGFTTSGTSNDNVIDKHGHAND